MLLNPPPSHQPLFFLYVTLGLLRKMWNFTGRRSRSKLHLIKNMIMVCSCFKGLWVRSLLAGGSFWRVYMCMVLGIEKRKWERTKKTIGFTHPLIKLLRDIFLSVFSSNFSRVPRMCICAPSRTPALVFSYPRRVLITCVCPRIAARVKRIALVSMCV